MSKFFMAVGNAVVETPPQELVGAVFVALLVALVVTGLFALGRRLGADAATLVTVLTLVACAGSMVLGSGYVHYRLGLVRTGFVEARRPGNRESSLAQRLLREADRDGDGLVSREEAARAAERFVGDADHDGHGGLDGDALRLALRDVLGPPPGPGPRPGLPRGR